MTKEKEHYGLLNSVFDAVKGMSSMNKHIEQYEEYMTSRKNRETKDVSMVAFEMCALTYTERNILLGTNFPNKFVVKGMCNGFTITTDVLLKKIKGSDNTGSNNVKHKKEHNLDFKGWKEISLFPMPCEHYSPARGDLLLDTDQSLSQRLASSCPNININTWAGLSTIMSTEKLSVEQDVRHLLLKGYLYCMDYTLACTSGYTQRVERDMLVRQKTFIKDSERLSAIIKHRIVVDAVHYSGDEIKLLCMMGNQFPCVEYSPGSIYSSFNMEDDDLIVLAQEDINIKNGYDMGSPTNMYNVLVGIANKLGAMEQLREVISSFRGIPRMARHMSMSGLHELDLKYKKSNTLTTCLSERLQPEIRITESSGYFATSKNLIADLLMGDCLTQTVCNSMMSLGCLGTLSNPGKSSKSSPPFQSLLRDYGLKSDNPGENMVLQAWSVINSNDHPIVYAGSLKEFGEWITDRMKVDDYLGMLPMLNFEMTGQHAGSNPWAACRGVDINKKVWVDPNVKRSEHMRVESMLWIMGINDKIPRVGYNNMGVTKQSVHTSAAYDKIALCNGQYELNHLSYTLGGVEARSDLEEYMLLNMNEEYFEGQRGMVTGTGNGIIGNTFPSKELTFKDGEITGTMAEPEDVDDDEADNRIVFTPGGSKLNPKQPERKNTMARLKIGSSVMSIKRDRPNFMIASKRTDLKIGLTSKGTVYDNIKVTQDKCLNGVEEIGLTVFDKDGDGKCGMIAIGQDLVLHGYVAENELDKLVKALDTESNVGSWQDAQELAAILNSRGMGLRLYDDTGDGVRVVDYGSVGAYHTVSIHRSNSNFSNCMQDEGGTRHKIHNYELGAVAEVSLERINEFSKYIYSER